MPIEFNMIAVILLPLVVALVISFLSTPIVKSFAYKLGAIDVPKDERRMHKVPIPRMGGLAIFLGFIISVLLFVEVDDQMKGILLGSVIIVVLSLIHISEPTFITVCRSPASAIQICSVTIPIGILGGCLFPLL